MGSAPRSCFPVLVARDADLERRRMDAVCWGSLVDELAHALSAVDSTGAIGSQSSHLPLCNACWRIGGYCFPSPSLAA